MLITNNPTFLADYEKMKTVSLNPLKHTAKNAHEHTEMVADRVLHLAKLNYLSEDEIALLRNLAYVHDIGKIQGTANPEKSVELLSKYDIHDEAFINLVKYHDINLPWFSTNEKSSPVPHKTWVKVAQKTNMKLLCIFMIADRVDCPGGWIANKPLVWFLDECEKKGLLESPINADEDIGFHSRQDVIMEHSAGAILIQKMNNCHYALLICTRDDQYEIPKGHIESEETSQEAALRELIEETGILNKVVINDLIQSIEYEFNKEDITIRKRVDFYHASLESSQQLHFDELPKRTNRIKWVKKSELDSITFVNKSLKDVLQNTFDTIE